MARRPEGVDRERWVSERKRVWRRRNAVLNLLMLIAIVAIYLRNCA